MVKYKLCKINQLRHSRHRSGNGISLAACDLMINPQGLSW